MKTDAWIENAAEALAKGISNRCGLNYTAPVAPPVTTDQLYRVQVGAYSIKDNADKKLKEVYDAGFRDAIISVLVYWSCACKNGTSQLPHGVL